MSLFLIDAAVSSLSRILPFAASGECQAVDASHPEKSSVTGYNRENIVETDCSRD